MPLWQAMQAVSRTDSNGFDMAGAAIVLERGMGLRQMAARPDLVGLEAGEALGPVLALVISMDRPGEADGQDERERAARRARACPA